MDFGLTLKSITERFAALRALPLPEEQSLIIVFSKATGEPRNDVVL